MMNIIIPMAGEGSRFKEAGYKKPKPFIDVLGKPMIGRVVENLMIKEARYIFIARKEDLDNEKETVDQLRSQYNCCFVEIDFKTEGTVCSVLSARKYILNDQPLMIANSDQIVDITMAEFVKDAVSRQLDGSILTFKDPTGNPKWSYVKSDDEGFVSEVKEKKAISDEATVGIYYYSKGIDFVNAAIDMIVRNDRTNNEFYTCPTYNYAIANNLKIGTYCIESSKMHGLGIPKDLNNYINLLHKRLG